VKAIFVLDPGYLQNAETFDAESRALLALMAASRGHREGARDRHVMPPVLYSTGVARRLAGGGQSYQTDVCRLDEAGGGKVWTRVDASFLSFKVRRALRVSP